MPVPRVAIVGRPNVGKSSLLNMIAAEKVAIVDDSPGVTRDRVAILADLEPPGGHAPDKPVEFIDTGGFGVYTAEGRQYNDVGEDLSRLTADIERQIGEAVATSDVVLFCVDCQAGITPEDERIARLLREGKYGRTKAGTRDQPAPRENTPPHARTHTAEKHAPIVVVATKCDGPRWEPHAWELAALGFGEPLATSAKSNYFRRDFLEALYRMLPEPEDAPEPDVDLKLAIVGRRNAGKSTLVNAIARQDRVIVSEIAGTTRDAVDVRVDDGERSLLVIDTAGIRRRRSLQDRVEWWAYDRARRAIDRADVVLFLLDATAETSQVDEQLGQLIQDAHKPAVLVVNKWDLAHGRVGIKNRPIQPEDYEEYLRKELKGLRHAPIALMSAARRLNIDETIDLAFELHRQAATRVGTGELNRIVRDILEQRGPSSSLGRRAKIYYVAQVAVCPPTIVMVVNDPRLFTPGYMRYLENRLREALPYDEVPIRLVVRGRTQRERHKARYETDDDAITGEVAAEIEALARENPAAFFEDD